MLEATVGRYKARAIETAQVIEELIALAKEMAAASRRGEELGLSEAELAFYDALETNDSAVAVLGDAVLRAIAQELTDTIRRNATIDWTARESVRANLRRSVRRILRRHGYPPDKQERATRTVLEQAEQLGLELVEAEARPEAQVIPFRRLLPSEAIAWENAVPLYSLKAAAGAFSDTQTVEAEDWVEPAGRIRPGPGLFVGRVVGQSMNRRIPDGSWCLFRAPVAGSREGRTLLVEHRDISDPDHGGQYTVKVYRRHGVDVRLEPDTDADGYQPIILAGVTDDAVRVVAEVVEVLPGQLPS